MNRDMESSIVPGIKELLGVSVLEIILWSFPWFLKGQLR